VAHRGVVAWLEKLHGYSSPLADAAVFSGHWSQPIWDAPSLDSVLTNANSKYPSPATLTWTCICTNMMCSKNEESDKMYANRSDEEALQALARH